MGNFNKDTKVKTNIYIYMYLSTYELSYNGHFQMVKLRQPWFIDALATPFWRVFQSRKLYQRYFKLVNCGQ